MPVWKLSTTSQHTQKKKKISHPSMAYKFLWGWLLFTSLRLFPILGPVSTLFFLSRVFFPDFPPGCLPAYSSVLRLNITVLEKLLLDWFDLPSDILTSSSLTSTSRHALLLCSLCCDLQLFICIYFLNNCHRPPTPPKFHDGRNYAQ